MGVGLALGHLPPALGPEQLLAERGDGGGSDPCSGLAERCEPLLVVVLDGVRPAGEIGEGLSVRR